MRLKKDKNGPDDDDEEGVEITMMHKWPVRQARPYKTSLEGNRALITG